MADGTNPAPAPAPSALAPVVERFAVPLLWFAAGWAIGRFMSGPKRVSE